MPEHDQQLGEFADVLERADRDKQLARDAAGGEVDREVALLRGSARAGPCTTTFPAALGGRVGFFALRPPTVDAERDVLLDASVATVPAPSVRSVYAENPETPDASVDI